jgi:hypothetical protein
MSDSAARLSRTRQEIEKDLLERVRKSQQEWISASEDNRDEARQRFMDALQTFNSLVLYAKFPNGK